MSDVVRKTDQHAPRRSTLFITRVRKELRYYRALYHHPDTPRMSRWLLRAALVYLVFPLDPIPDFIPVLGHVDELVVIPVLVFAAVALIPRHVKAACRAGI